MALGVALREEDDELGRMLRLKDSLTNDPEIEHWLKRMREVDQALKLGESLEGESIVPDRIPDWMED